MSPEPFEDYIWADPERVLAPTKEDRMVRALEESAEERLCACWADEALQACLNYHPEQSVYYRELFTRTRVEVNQYLSVLDELMIRGVDELRMAGRECSKDLFVDPRAEVKAILAVDLALESFNKPLDLMDRPPEVQQHLPTIRHLELAVRCYEHAISRIENLLLRFTNPKEKLVCGYSTKKLKEILRVTRKELFVCFNTTEEQWEAALDKLPEPEPSPDWKPSAEAKDPHHLDLLLGRAPVGNLPIREIMPPAAKRRSGISHNKGEKKLLAQGNANGR